eukprot:TRINITY_DN4408_c0_g2_i1.p1 TRINITY_DN4408_c0_g2~~TRINITY_DN4408_c0_g2_i1.p1  ORF type:complete len:513 (+),score=128.58 TRINITY_DN4408_c0_g2_i1:156-1541(+)
MELEQRALYGMEKLHKLYEVFKHVDVDHSWDLDLMEYKRLMRTLYMFPGLNEPNLERFFYSFDGDKSGTIDYKELATMLCVFCKAPSEEKLAYMFDLYDEEKFGEVDKSEIMSIVGQLESLAKALRRDMNKLQPWLDKINAVLNNDSVSEITRNEWVSVGTQCEGLMQILESGDWWPNPMTGPLAKELARRTNYGKLELRKLRGAFDEFDTDQSGDLNIIEFRKIICGLRLFPGASVEILDTLFSSFDNDNSESISFNELATALAVLSKATPEEKLLYMFEIYDKDGSGDLDVAEVQAIVQQIKIVIDALGREKTKVEPFIRIVMDEGDADQSGTISKMEWMKAARKANGFLELLQFNTALAAPSPEDTPEGSPTQERKGGDKKKDKDKKDKKDKKAKEKEEKAKKEDLKKRKARMKEIEKEEKQYQAKGDISKQYEIPTEKNKRKSTSSSNPLYNKKKNK